ncbi:MAG: hypothetical protein US25_C0042G0007 [Candidatus Moranbacteria bacterium GW2011_GWE1_36_7]|nr:MAG: hypothetical protein UR99_C0055G0007 [Candidatus Moranbacteria bacterium GW2011_GWD2_36_12]KKQ13138.1 MAG: hypothetical protein US25_C0042G0007 [Candidatus Moranbacteria bacterium GW2011_GWE1_36_7]
MLLVAPFIFAVSFILSGCSNGDIQKEAQKEVSTIEQAVEGVEISKEQEIETSQPLAETTVTSAPVEKIVSQPDKKDVAKESDNKKKKDDDKKDEDENEKEEKEKPEPCFKISGNQYNADTFYLGILKLDADCSKDSTEYQWYINGNNAGAGKTYAFSYKNPSTLNKIKIDIKNPFEIKLIATSKDGLVDSTAKTIKFREIPNPTICFNQESSKVKEFSLGEEYEFDASCSTYSEENPITKYAWKFRDGGIDDAIKKEGVKVKYSFSKPSTTWEGGECGGPNDRLEVQLDIETKIGGSFSNIHHYCIK